MWVMIVIGGMFGSFSTAETSAVSTSMVAVEFSSQQRCRVAVQQSLKQPKVHAAWCVQK